MRTGTNRTAGTDVVTVVDESNASTAVIPTAAQWMLGSALVLAIGSTPDGPLIFILGLPLILVSLVIGAGAAWRVGRPGTQPWLGFICTLLSVMTAATIVSSST